MSPSPSKSFAVLISMLILVSLANLMHLGFQSVGSNSTFAVELLFDIGIIVLLGSLLVQFLKKRDLIDGAWRVESKFQTLVQSSPFCIHEIGLDGKLLSMNSAGLCMMGVESESEILGKQYMDIPISVDQERVRLLFENACLGNSSAFEFEVDVDGETAIFSSCFAPIFDTSGQIVKLMGITQNVTDRVQVERELHSARGLANAANTQAEEVGHRFKSLAESVPFPVGIISKHSKDRKFLYANSHLEKEFGVQTNDPLPEEGNPFGLAVNDLRVLREEMLLYGSVVDKECNLISPSKGEMWGLVTIVDVKYDDEDCYYICMKDVTANKLHEIQLGLARDKAEAANIAKSEFLANMSHEIRTPMNGVLGMASLALSSDIPDDAREYIGMIQESGESMMRILGDILDVSKLEAAEVEIEEIEVNLNQLVESVSALMEPQIVSCGLSYNDNVSDALQWPQVISDPTRIRQILLNLLSNAKKFTQEGSIELNLSQNRLGDGQIGIRFEVKDTGIGVRNEVQGEIFESFSQADQSTTRKYGGTGLGLSICKKLVELMGGCIGVESEPGTGSTFWFTIVCEEFVEGCEIQSRSA